MTVVRARDVTFGYRRGVRVLRSVSAEIGPGLTVLLGPNGAGKSTLARLLMGFVRPWKGRAEIDGKPVETLNARERARRVGFVSQRPEVAAAFRVREVVALGRYGVGPDESAVSSALERMELADLARRAFATLSVGQQQRVTIARALAQIDGSPTPALIADEPFSAMDPAHSLRAAGIVSELGRSGASVLLVLHDFTLARRIADRAILLDSEGNAASTGPAAEVLTPRLLERVFGVAFHECQTPGGAALVSAGP